MKEGNEKINEIMENLLTDSTLLPKPMTYEDFDTEFTNFISNEINIKIIGFEIPTYFFTQQRMSEFTKNWEMVDVNKNIVPNFKIVTRENNPKPGNMMGGMANIPGDPLFDIGTFNKWNGTQNITVTYKMKQPYCVDFTYNVKFVTNRLSLLNMLNNVVIEKFKAKQAFLVINGHYVKITLDDIGDESEYDIEQRKIFVQNFKMIVSGYIINEEDIIVKENINKFLLSVESDHRKPKFVNSINDNNMSIEFPIKGRLITNFKSDIDFNVSSIKLINILYYDITVNNIPVDNVFSIKKYDRIIIKIIKEEKNKLSKVIFE